MKLTSIEYEEKLRINMFAAEKMLSLLPASVRKKYARPGIPTDTIAELISAYALGTLASNGEGYDLDCGTEVKYSTIVRNKNGQTYNTYANVGNLKSKTGDLLIVVGDPRGNKKDIELLFFFIPFNKWKEKIKGDKLSMSFGSTRWKWYMDYLYTWKELCTGKRGLENFC
jgi:hypothetical protein